MTTLKEHIIDLKTKLNHSNKEVVRLGFELFILRVGSLQANEKVSTL